MLRLRFRPAARRPFLYRNTDLVKDAVANMLLEAGAPRDRVLGRNAAHWAAGVVFGGKLTNDRNVRKGIEVVVSTSDSALAGYLARSKPENMYKAQRATGELLDMSGGSIVGDMDPVIADMTSFIEARCLTPICVSRRGDRSDGKWHNHVLDCDVSAAVNTRLSRIAGRQVALNIIPDEEYLATRARHYVNVAYKEATDGGRSAVIVALSFPFVLQGSTEDLKLAWYAGLGERNRQGFGLIGLA